MSRPRSRTRFQALALSAICAVSLGVAACGDDDEPTTTTESTEIGATGTEGSTDVDAIREQFDEAVRTSLEAQAAAGAPVDVDCALDKLEGALSDEDVQALVDAFNTGEAPPTAITEELTAVGQECTTQ